MPAIQQQTWQEASALTWGSLSPHRWMDFRISLQDGSGEMQATGVTLVNGKASFNAIAETDIQGVRVEYALANITNEVEMIVSVAVAKKDYYGAMLSYLPTYHHQAMLTNELLKTYSKELKRLEFNVNDVQDNWFVDTTVSQIDRWERILGLTPDKNKPYSFRRERIKSKLRAIGTVTKAMIQNVASAFSNGEVEVVEHPAECRFEVKFTGTKGIPENMADLTQILEDVKPAHLAFEYSYTYNNWGFVADQTWGSVAGLTWEGLQTY